MSVTARFDKTTVEAIAPKVLELAQLRPEKRWIRRRAERLVLIDDRTIERVVDLHIDFAEFELRDLPLVDDELLVLPLHFMNRVGHVVSDARAEGLGELMRPTGEIERQIVCAGLEKKWSMLPDEIRTRMFALVNGPASQPPLLPRIRNGLANPKDLMFNLVFDAIHSCPDIEIATFVDFLEDLAFWQQKYLLLAEVPTAQVRHGHAIMSVRFTEEHPRARLIGQGGMWRNVKRLAAQFRKLLLGSPSWRLRIQISRAISQAESTHVAVEAPDGFRVIDAGVNLTCRINDGSERRVWFRDDGCLQTSGHMHLNASKLDIIDGDVKANFYPFSTGFVIEGVAAGWILLGIIWAYYHRMQYAGFNASKSGLTTEIASALVLLLPAAAITIVTQRDSHRVAGRCFALPRLLLTLSASASVFAALLLVMDTRVQVAHPAWQAVLGVEIFVAARLTVGLLVHFVRTSRLRAWVFRNVRFGRDLAAQREVFEAAG